MRRAAAARLGRSRSRSPRPPPPRYACATFEALLRGSAGALGADLERGAPQEEPLSERDVQIDQGLALGLDLDALGDQGGADAVADRREARDDLPLDRVVVEVAHERVGD